MWRGIASGRCKPPQAAPPLATYERQAPARRLGSIGKLGPRMVAACNRRGSKQMEPVAFLLLLLDCASDKSNPPIFFGGTRRNLRGVMGGDMFMLHRESAVLG